MDVWIDFLRRLAAYARKPSFCRDRFSKLIKAVHDWERNDSSDILVPWMQSRVKGFSHALELAFENFLDETADAGRDVAPDSRLFICRIDQLAHEYDRFKRGIAEESPSCSPGGTDGLWRSLRNVEEAFKQTPNLAKPQPVRQMIEDGVTVMQIASIYGWVDEYNNPDVHTLGVLLLIGLGLFWLQSCYRVHSSPCHSKEINSAMENLSLRTWTEGIHIRLANEF